MAKGRKKIPSKIIEMRGGSDLTHRPRNTQEPTPPEKMPRCPAHLDKRARTEWKRAGKILQSIGLMSELDMAVLAGYCQSYSEWIAATEKVQEMGMVYKKADGTPGLNPYLRVSRESYDRMIKAAVLIGMSPSSRANLKVEKPKQQSRAESFRSRKNG